LQNLICPNPHATPSYPHSLFTPFHLPSSSQFGGFIAFECKIRGDSPMVVRALRESDHKVAMLTGAALYCNVLCFAAVYYVVKYCTVVNINVLYCNVLSYAVLVVTVLHFTPLLQISSTVKCVL
jgi:hypothetical protein